MRNPILVASCVATLLAPLTAQSAEQRIHGRWPGEAILKATEAEFEAFVAMLPASVEKADALDAFLRAQWTAHGLPSDHPNKSFLSPLGGRLVTTIPTDSGVQEGPEPNGDPTSLGGGTPTPMACGDQGEGRVFPYGDRDWWTITLPAAQRILAATGPGLESPIGDTMLELYDSNGTLLLANDDYAPRGRYSQLAMDATAGTYHIAVRGYADVRTGTYSLDVVCGAAMGGGPMVVNEPPEPNASANTAGSITCGDMVFGNVNPSGDHDWYGLVVTSNTNVRFETFAGSSGASLSDSTLTLRSSNGTQLAFDDDGGGGLYSLITAALVPGTYYIDVGGYAAYTGTYDLAITCEVETPEAPEPNNTQATATALPCGMIGGGSIQTTGDSDWWAIVISGNTTITLETGPGAGFALSDTTLTLRDAAGAQLAFDDDGGINAYSRISMPLTPGTYYADVQGYSTGTGSYVLEVSCTGGSSSASFTAAAGGCSGSAGVPTLSARSYELPVLGGTFAFELANLPAGAPSVSFFGFSTTQITGGGMLPLDLAVVGAPGCRIEVDPLALLPMPAPSGGVAVGYLFIPGDQALVGLAVHVQSAVVDLSANQLGLTLSNRGTAVLGEGL